MNARPHFWGDLTPLRYRLIVCDPPWSIKMRSPRGLHKSPEAHYRTMADEEILGLPVDHLAADDCLLLCWATWPRLPFALQAAAAWGFRYSTIIVWRKIHASGKQCSGTGYRARGMCEPVILAYFGAPRHQPFPGIFAGVRREHSRKPEEFYAIVDRCCPDLVPRADLFTRERRAGWDGFGDEVGKFCAPAPAPLFGGEA